MKMECHLWLLTHCLTLVLILRDAYILHTVFLYDIGMFLYFPTFTLLLLKTFFWPFMFCPVRSYKRLAMAGLWSKCFEGGVQKWYSRLIDDRGYWDQICECAMTALLSPLIWVFINMNMVVGIRKYFTTDKWNRFLLFDLVIIFFQLVYTCHD